LEEFTDIKKKKVEGTIHCQDSNK